MKFLKNLKINHTIRTDKCWVIICLKFHFHSKLENRLIII